MNRQLAPQAHPSKLSQNLTAWPRGLALAALAAFALACGDDPASGGQDGATTSGDDASTVVSNDASTALDAGVATDAGPGDDAGTVETDSGTPVETDGGSPADAATCAPLAAGDSILANADFEDWTAGAPD